MAMLVLEQSQALAHQRVRLTIAIRLTRRSRLTSPRGAIPQSLASFVFLINHEEAITAIIYQHLRTNTNIITALIRYGLVRDGQPVVHR